MSGQVHLPRGLVTFLFTDIEGSTRLAQMLGAGYRSVLVEHRRVLRAVLSARAGVPLFCEGDSLFAAFPGATEAICACVAAQQALTSHDWSGLRVRPRVRMGLHTGYAEPHAGEYASPEVHRAARIADAAHGGQVLCSAATARAAGQLPDRVRLRDLGLHRLRGFDGRERIFQIVAPGLLGTFPRLRTVPANADNLPAALTSFVGRAAEQAELATLTAAHRLVTVVGPAGAGKTRLAVRVASGRAGGHPDGVWYVDLAHHAEVHEAIGAQLGLRAEPGRSASDTLADFVASRRLLLVLDTCDARPAAAGLAVRRLLASAPDLRVLSVGRQPLGVPGEVVWRIPSLPAEPGADGEPGDAVRLLLERVSAARGGRRPHPSETKHLVRLARRLDGLPLALELAADRLRVLSAGELAARLDGPNPIGIVSTVDGVSPSRADRPGESTVDVESSSVDASSIVDVEELVAPGTAEGRHGSLQAAFSWSYRALTPRSARLLRWLSVFSGPVDLSAVAWLAGEDPLGVLADLVDKSLVHVESSASATTYRMLNTIRGYAAARLTEAGEDGPAYDRHVAWTRHALAVAHLGPDRRPVTLNLRVLDRYAGEARAALHWTVERGSARQGLRIAVLLDQWWRERGLAAEGRDWLRRLYARMAATGEDVPDAELARAYQMHAMHAGADGEHAEELRFLARAEVTAARTGDQRLLLRVRAGAGMPLVDLGSPAEAERTCRSVLGTARERGSLPDALYAIYCLAQLLWQRGALDEAAELLAAARAAEAARPAERGRRTVDMILGMVALARGDLVAAHDHLTVALRSRMTHGFYARAVQAISGFAVRCALGGSPEVAARLFGAAEAARTRLRSSAGCYGGYWTQQQGQLRDLLGDEAFDRGYASGAELSLDEAATLALSIEHPDLAAGSPRFTHTADSPTP